MGAIEAATLTVLTLGAASWWLLPRWRLRRALARPLPKAALDILARNVAQYRGMAPELQRQLQTLVRQFLHQKTFVGCAGLEVTDEMRVTIAGQACLLLLNRHSRVYPGLDTILVYPDVFVAPRKEVDAAGVVHDAPRGLLGESWGDGRVLLSWEHVRRHGHAAPGAQNVVLHEFAHQLDSESGSNNGAPYLGSLESYRSWSAVLSHAFEALRRDAMLATGTMPCSIITVLPAQPNSLLSRRRVFSSSHGRWQRGIRRFSPSFSNTTGSIRATGARAPWW